MSLKDQRVCGWQFCFENWFSNTVITYYSATSHTKHISITKQLCLNDPTWMCVEEKQATVEIVTIFHLNGFLKRGGMATAEWRVSHTNLQVSHDGKVSWVYWTTELFPSVFRCCHGDSLACFSIYPKDKSQDCHVYPLVNSEELLFGLSNILNVFRKHLRDVCLSHLANSTSCSCWLQISH